MNPTPPPPPPPDTRTYHTFDRSTIPTWIYPTNYPIRGYQFNIVKKALFNNTLVALPTGLGKTLIAAVVMYNYYRWFPDSIMIFMAPTRPLVEQQIEACYKVCGIPQNQTEILMGKTDAKKRAGLWASKRVFYATPQIVRNDIASGICPSHKIVLLVVDEAHRATGGYAYTEVIQKLARIHSHYRILALSATPGSRLEQVQSVVTNLRINNIEIRTEDSMDVQEFNFGKKIQRIVIRLDYTAGATGVVPQTARTFCEQLFIPVLERLKKRQFIPDAQPERWSPYALLSNQRLYQATAKNVPQAVKNMVFQDFSIAHSFSRAYENLCTYGIGSFVETVEGILQGFREKINGGKNLSKEQYKLLNHIGLNQLLDRLRQQMESPSFVSHPKLDNLTSIIIRHLTDYDDDNNSTTSSTRIIIFSSLRNSVEMITKHLSTHKPLIRCAPFIGQGSDKGGGKGMNQKEQHETIQKLKKGEINVIVATSIGEEGLDIGEVDLIVCYDSQSSPIRMLQRMGRTGRKRQGHCVMLMTEQEERKYNNANDTYKRVQRQISDRNSIQYYENCPSFYNESILTLLRICHQRFWVEKENDKVMISTKMGL
ncbi:P-loop containing nucleoside triphosphate hydrolase protein [Cunninghamella echinulata]|nr:P-loop containing nucleoside triphosphate hydrolase protein [Cunninghamella echinulata]